MRREPALLDALRKKLRACAFVQCRQVVEDLDRVLRCLPRALVVLVVWACTCLSDHALLVIEYDRLALHDGFNESVRETDPLAARRPFLFEALELRFDLFVDLIRGHD